MPIEKSIEEVRALYQAKLSLHEALKEEVLFEVRKALEGTDIKFHSISARIKELDSVVAKIEGKECGEDFGGISDIVGARVVTLFLSDIHRIVELLKKRLM